MEKFGKSQPVKRVEDVRFLTGKGRYVDDIVPDGALHGYVFRSYAAHARIVSLDVTEARNADGVHLVLTADDLLAEGVDIAMRASVLKNRDGSSAAALTPMLARGRVRFVGEPIAMIFAETLLQARDAAELIELDLEDLPAKVDVVAGGEPLHDEAPDNRAFDWGLGDEDETQAAFDAAAHVVSLEVDDNRIIVNSMEPRGCFAEWDGKRLHLSVNGQGVWAQKDQLVELLRLKPDDVRVTNPDVGGGFGIEGHDLPGVFLRGASARMPGTPGALDVGPVRGDAQ